MNIIFMRHGIAKERTPEIAEFDRQLTEQGIRKVEKIARWMHKKGIVIDGIISSPLIRAKQTAEIVAAEYGLEDKLEFNEALGLNASLENVSRIIHGQAFFENILLVGHEPSFGEIVGEMIGAGSIPLKKAAIAGVAATKIDRNEGTLLYYVPPRLMA